MQSCVMMSGEQFNLCLSLDKEPCCSDGGNPCAAAALQTKPSNPAGDTEFFRSAVCDDRARLCPAYAAAR